MPFSREEGLVAVRFAHRELKRSGVSDVPVEKPEFLAAVDAILAIWESTNYRNAINNAINAAIPGNTLTGAQKRIIHESAMRAAIAGGKL